MSATGRVSIGTIASVVALAGVVIRVVARVNARIMARMLARAWLGRCLLHVLHVDTWTQELLLNIPHVFQGLGLGLGL